MKRVVIATISVCLVLLVFFSVNSVNADEKKSLERDVKIATRVKDTAKSSIERDIQVATRVKDTAKSSIQRDIDVAKRVKDTAQASIERDRQLGNRISVLEKGGSGEDKDVTVRQNLQSDRCLLFAMAMKARPDLFNEENFWKDVDTRSGLRAWVNNLPYKRDELSQKYAAVSVSYRRWEVVHDRWIPDMLNALLQPAPQATATVELSQEIIDKLKSLVKDEVDAKTQGWLEKIDAAEKSFAAAEKAYKDALAETQSAKKAYEDALAEMRIAKKAYEDALAPKTPTVSANAEAYVSVNIYNEDKKGYDAKIFELQNTDTCLEEKIDGVAKEVAINTEVIDLLLTTEGFRSAGKGVQADASLFLALMKNYESARAARARLKEMLWSNNKIADAVSFAADAMYVPLLKYHAGDHGKVQMEIRSWGLSEKEIREVCKKNGEAPYIEIK